MQDEINEKVIALSIRTTKLTAEMLQKSIRFMLSQIKKQLDKPVQHHGKQTLGRYPQLYIPRLLRRLDLDDAGLHCQCRCAVCQMLFRHVCSPPVFATQTLPQPCSESY